MYKPRKKIEFVSKDGLFYYEITQQKTIIPIYITEEQKNKLELLPHFLLNLRKIVRKKDKQTYVYPVIIIDRKQINLGK